MTIEANGDSVWAVLADNPLWEKRISAETKVLLKYAQIQTLSSRELLVILVAMQLEGQRQNTPRILSNLSGSSFFLGLPYMTWFTGVTAFFGSLILGVSALTFAIYFGYMLGHNNRSEINTKAIIVPLEMKLK